MSELLTLLLGIVVVVGITAGTGYFVAQEFAYMTVDRSRLEARSKAGDTVAARTLAVTKRTSFMLSGAQLGITVTGLLVGNFAEPLIGQSLGTLLGGVGIPSGVGLAVGAVTALVVSTFVQMLFGELFPKNFAIARPEPVARWLSLSTTIYLKLFGWLIRIFDASSNALLKALKIEPVHDVEHSATPRDLEHIVAESRGTGDLPEELSTLLDRILDFPTQTTGHAMIPRAKVATVRSDSTIAEVRALMSVEHSRYPVLHADDSIEGVVHLRDVLATDLPGDTPVAVLSRDALVLPETQMLPDAMGSFARRRTNSPASSTNTAPSPVSSPSRTWPRSSSARSPTSTTTPTARNPCPATTVCGRWPATSTSTRWNVLWTANFRRATSRPSPDWP